MIERVEIESVARPVPSGHSLVAIFEPDGTVWLDGTTSDPAAFAHLLHELGRALLEWPDMVAHLAGLAEPHAG